MKTIWKVLIGIGIFIVLIIALAYCGTKGVSDVAKETLSAIKSQDYAKAYALTSSEFQKVTTLDAFKSFVGQYPALKDYSKFSISSQKVEDNTGQVMGSLIYNSKEIPIEIGLVKENSDWKILSIQLESAPTTIGIYDVLISDIADTDGYVSETKTILAKNAPHIYATVQVAGAKKGSIVTAKLVYEGSGDTVGPIENPVDQDGDVLKAFSFTNTEGEWPAGDYTVHVSLSTGEAKQFKFKVE